MTVVVGCVLSNILIVSKLYLVDSSVRHFHCVEVLSCDGHSSKTRPQGGVLMMYNNATA